MTTLDIIPIGERTQRMFPIPRDTDTTPRNAFNIVDPATTGTLPHLAQIAIELGRRADMQTAARIAAERRLGPPGRHRAPEPSLLDRLFGRGRRGGA